MTRTTPEYLRNLAELVEAGECEVGRVEIRNGGIVFGVFMVGTLEKYERTTEQEGE